MKKKLQIFLFSLLCILVISPLTVLASTGLIEQSNVRTLFYNIYENTPATTSMTYPYSAGASDAAVRSLAFDTLYGTSRQLMNYVGEIPYANTHDENGKAYSGFSSIPYNEYTEHSLTNDTSTGSAEDYWGTGVASAITTNGSTLTSYEALNSTGILSLRIYALQNAKSMDGLFVNASGFGYSIVSAIAGFVAYGCKFAVMLKNVSISSILETLKIDKLSTVLYNLFVVNESTNASGQVTGRTLSPIAVFCLVAFMFTVVGYVVSYIRGTQKSVNLLTDVVLIALCGLVVIYMGYGKNALTLGSGVANVTNALITSALEPDGETNIWTTSVVDSGNFSADSSETTMHSEISRINKLYIDIQICTQFGVASIDELDYANLGDTNGNIARNILSKYDFGNTTISAGDVVTNFKNGSNGNLGYYYWWANSPYATITNTSISQVNNSQSEKLTQMITYLQACYNHTSDTATRNNIQNIMLSLTRPHAASGALTMLMLAIVYVLLFICVITYALRAALAKMWLLLAIVFLPIAGLLLITANAKLTEYGKGLLGMFITSFVRVTVYSLLFDLVIHVVTQLLTTSFLNMVVVGLLIYIFFKLSPIINEALENTLTTFENRVAPATVSLRNTASRVATKYSRQHLDKHSEPEKIVGYDSNGQAIKVKSFGQRVSNAAASFIVNGAENGVNKKTWTKIGHELHTANKNERDTAIHALDAADRSTAMNAVNQAKAKVDDIEANIASETEQRVAEKYQYGQFNYSALSSAEQLQYNELCALDAELDELTNKDEYRKLRRTDFSSIDNVAQDLPESGVAKLTDTQRKLYNMRQEKIKYDRELNDKQLEYNTKKQELLDNISSNAKTAAEQSHAKDLNAAIDEYQQTVEDNLDTLKATDTTVAANVEQSSNETERKRITPKINLKAKSSGTAVNAAPSSSQASTSTISTNRSKSEAVKSEEIKVTPAAESTAESITTADYSVPHTKLESEFKDFDVSKYLDDE